MSLHHVTFLCELSRHWSAAGAHPHSSKPQSLSFQSFFLVVKRTFVTPLPSCFSIPVIMSLMTAYLPVICTWELLVGWTSYFSVSWQSVQVKRIAYKRNFIRRDSKLKTQSTAVLLSAVLKCEVAGRFMVVMFLQSILPQCPHLKHRYHRCNARVG